jgi:hypothetical protein
MTTASLDLPEIAFFGRSLAEYEKQFSIRTSALVGKRVLDCAAGPSSFATEAACCAVDVVAVDPLYNRNEAALRMTATAARHRMFAQMRARPELFTMRSFASFDDAEIDRRHAAERFLADFYSGVALGRYVAGALPRLPFADAAFDLVLCGHLLFVYEAKLDLAFHIAAALELCRVGRGEVRIHPLVNPAGDESRFVEPLCAELAARGIRSEIIDLDYAFFRGATRTLILRQRG